MTTPSAMRVSVAFLGLLLGSWVVSASAAQVGNIDGVWANNAAACNDIFSKSDRGGISFKRDSDAFGIGLVIDGGRIREKLQQCRIVSRNQKGDTVQLVALCSSDVSADTVQFGLRVLDDDHIVRSYPGMTGLELTYERCRF